MATTTEDEKQAPGPQTILIAYLQAELVSGETLDLLPIRHENDVKSDVTKLLEDWHQSGFLLRGSVAYPWHQVKRVQVTRVEELLPHEVHQRMLELEGADRAQLAKGFWKSSGQSVEPPKQDGKEDQEQEGK